MNLKFETDLSMSISTYKAVYIAVSKGTLLGQPNESTQTLTITAIKGLRILAISADFYYASLSVSKSGYQGCGIKGF